MPARESEYDARSGGDHTWDIDVKPPNSVRYNLRPAWDGGAKRHSRVAAAISPTASEARARCSSATANTRYGYGIFSTPTTSTNSGWSSREETPNSRYALESRHLEYDAALGGRGRSAARNQPPPNGRYWATPTSDPMRDLTTQYSRHEPNRSESYATNVEYINWSRDNVPAWDRNASYEKQWVDHSSVASGMQEAPITSIRARRSASSRRSADSRTQPSARVSTESSWGHAPSHFPAPVSSSTQSRGGDAPGGAAIHHVSGGRWGQAPDRFPTKRDLSVSFDIDRERGYAAARRQSGDSWARAPSHPAERGFGVSSGAQLRSNDVREPVAPAAQQRSVRPPTSTDSNWGRDPNGMQGQRSLGARPDAHHRHRDGRTPSPAPAHQPSRSCGREPRQPQPKRGSGVPSGMQRERSNARQPTPTQAQKRSARPAAPLASSWSRAPERFPTKRDLSVSSGALRQQGRIRAQDPLPTRQSPGGWRLEHRSSSPQRDLSVPLSTDRQHGDVRAPAPTPTQRPSVRIRIAAGSNSGRAPSRSPHKRNMSVRSGEQRQRDGAPQQRPDASWSRSPSRYPNKRNSVAPLSSPRQHSRVRAPKPTGSSWSLAPERFASHRVADKAPPARSRALDGGSRPASPLRAPTTRPGSSRNESSQGETARTPPPNVVAGGRPPNQFTPRRDQGEAARIQMRPRPDANGPWGETTAPDARLPADDSQRARRGDGGNWCSCCRLRRQPNEEWPVE